MIYHTDSALIRHLFGNLIPQIMKKYTFTDEEIVRLLEAKKIMFNKTKEIDKENGKNGV